MRQFLEQVTGLSIYPLLSFILFGLFFLLMLIWLFTERKQYFSTMKQLPLEPDSKDSSSAIHV